MSTEVLRCSLRLQCGAAAELSAVFLALRVFVTRNALPVPTGRAFSLRHPSRLEEPEQRQKGGEHQEDEHNRDAEHRQSP